MFGRHMDPAESWKAIFRHHKVTELEVDMLRARAKALEKCVLRFSMFGALPEGIPPLPPKTPKLNWRTHRMQDGTFPLDVREHLDWLSKEDF